jgi:hypothetical protein
MPASLLLSSATSQAALAASQVLLGAADAASVTVGNSLYLAAPALPLYAQGIALAAWPGGSVFASGRLLGTRGATTPVCAAPTCTLSLRTRWWRVAGTLRRWRAGPRWR